MNRLIRVIAMAAAALCAAGCTSSGISVDEREISAGFVREVARNAVRDALTAPKIVLYVEKFRADNGGRIPVLKFAKAINETRNPELDTSVVYDEFSAALHKSDKMAITRVEGAADLVMLIKATSAEIRERDRRVTEYAFTVEMVEVRNSISLWQYRKIMGFASK